MKKPKYLTIGLAAFFIGLIYQVPARFVYQQFSDESHALHASAIEGTLWNGRAGSVKYKDYNLGEVSWDSSLWQSIKRLGLVNHMVSKNGEVVGQSNVGMSVFRELLVSDAKFVADSRILRRELPMLKSTGDVVATLHNLRWKKDQLPMIDGLLEWRSGMVTAPINLGAGDYAFKLTPNDSNGMNIDVRSSDAPVVISGSISIDEKMNYATDLTLLAEDQDLKPTINMLGRRDAQGRVVIDKQGNIAEFL